MNIFTAPFFALFSIPFYRQALQARVWKAVQYALFLSAVSTALVMFQLTRVGVPEADRFVDWLQSQMPVITLTSEGLSMDRESPFSIVHEEFGPLATFDLSKKEAGARDMENIFVYVTAGKIYLQQAAGDIRAYNVQDFIDRNQERLAQGPLAMSPDTIGRFYKTVKPWFLVLMTIVVFLFDAVVLLVGGLLLSWIGLVLNMSRVPPLSYGALYTASIFALTAGTVFTWLGTLLPPLGAIPFGYVISVILNIAYLFVAVRMTTETKSA
ncbi:MAG: DUF1189 family protein [Candidatus Omnitrophota bacterium]